MTGIRIELFSDVPSWVELEAITTVIAKKVGKCIS